MWYLYAGSSLEEEIMVEDTTYLALIKDTVKRFQVVSGQNGFMHDIEYMEFVNLASYFVPDIHFSVGQALESEKEIKLAQFCEIWIDKVCIYREASMLAKDANENMVLMETRKKLVNSLLIHGVQIAYNRINGYERE